MIGLENCSSEAGGSACGRAGWLWRSSRGDDGGLVYATHLIPVFSYCFSFLSFLFLTACMANTEGILILLRSLVGGSLSWP